MHGRASIFHGFQNPSNCKIKFGCYLRMRAKGLGVGEGCWWEAQAGIPGMMIHYEGVYMGLIL